MLPAGWAPRRLLIGPVEVAGVGQGLQRGLAEIGIASELVLECRHPFGYAASEATSAWVRAWNWAGTRARAIAPGNLWLKAPLYALHLVLGWAVLLWALVRFDTFVFLYGKTLTNTLLELWILRALRRPVVVIFLGSDARPAYVNGVWPGADVAELGRMARRQKCRLRRLERWSTACVNAPGTAHFHERAVVNWFALGLARSVAPLAPTVADGAATTAGPRCDAADVPASPTVRIVHSPSHPVLKGTAVIQAAVERLQHRGFDVEFESISGLTNEQVLAALRRCDLVVDQLYSDTPMAGLATEAALLGKPVLVGGYLAREMPEALGDLPVPPTRFVAPEDFERALEELVASPPARAALGAAAAQFVRTEWSASAVAARLLRILRGDVPPSWWLDPATVTYLAGCGLAEDAGRERVRRLIRHAGLGALQLADKPGLEAAYAAWVGTPAPGDAFTDRLAVP
jgi:hypothetical protein